VEERGGAGRRGWSWAGCAVVLLCGQASQPSSGMVSYLQARLEVCARSEADDGRDEDEGTHLVKRWVGGAGWLCSCRCSVGVAAAAAQDGELAASSAAQGQACPPPPHLAPLALVVRPAHAPPPPAPSRPPSPSRERAPPRPGPLSPPHTRPRPSTTPRPSTGSARLPLTRARRPP